MQRVYWLANRRSSMTWQEVHVATHYHYLLTVNLNVSRMYFTVPQVSEYMFVCLCVCARAGVYVHISV